MPALLSSPDLMEAEVRRDLAWTKRFLEYWSADPAFRQALPSDPNGVARSHGLEVNAEELRPLWTFDRTDPVHQQPLSLSVQRYRAFIGEKLNYRTTLRQASEVQHAGFRAWRQRQVQRCYSQLGHTKGDALVHAGLAVELSQGCSVGCWFCGISALKLGGNWDYTPEHEQLWKGVLSAISGQLGDAASRGFCYWATDPLDNPDYESFCLDFYQKLGHFPQTTTAQPLKDPARWRALHNLSRAHGNEIDRFSVLSLAGLKRIFAEYSPEELLFVELILQMDGALAGKAFAGKARQKEAKWKKSTGTEVPAQDITSTIACVSGLLLRMPERSFELVSPCRADERWPNGYRVYARRTFADAADFAGQLQEVLHGLPERLPLDQPIQVRSDLQVEFLEEGFALVNYFYRHCFRAANAQALRKVGEALQQGGRTALELALLVESEQPLQETLVFLNQLFAGGLLDDEP